MYVHTIFICPLAWWPMYSPVAEEEVCALPVEQSPVLLIRMQMVVAVRSAWLAIVCGEKGSTRKGRQS